MPTKPKIGIYWCASCGGCEEAIVDLAEDILGLVQAVDIMFWPVAMDFKKSDVEALPDKGLVLTLMNGAIRSTEQEEMARMLRRKSQLIIAYGSCAHTGGIPGLANQYSREQILQYVYEQSPTTVNEAKTRPQLTFQEAGREVHLPQLWNVVRSLDQVVEVDYYIPGCPPTPNVTKAALGAVLEGRLPAKGSVLAPDVALCQECARKDTKPANVSFKEFVRPHQKLLDPSLCFLAQGVICMGPSTRSGCGAQCTSGNMPCTGCFSGTDRVKDQGAKMLSSICSNIEPKDEKGIDEVLKGVVDPIGTFYRYGLAKSILRRKVNLNVNGKA